MLTGRKLDHVLKELYGADHLQLNWNRYLDLLQEASQQQTSSNLEPFVVSVPGRTELGGNHTDHNHGRVLAASINHDCVGLIYPSPDTTITIHSTAIERDIVVDLSELDPIATETGLPEGLVRGVAAAWCREHSLRSGFTAYLDNTIPIGGGLSSSAAFGTLIGAALSQANGVAIDRTRLAHYAHQAENRYFGKPCGLMDQLSCSLGGLIAIDFKNPREPIAEQIHVDLTRFGYRLLLIDTGSSHAELTGYYAAIPEEMKLVTDRLHVDCGRELSLETLLEKLPEIRRETGDRPLLRMLHFLMEDDRAARQAELLRNGRFHEFLDLVRKSGDSSWRLLQNCLTESTKEQPVALGIVLCQTICPNAVARIHGGGFAGTIQVWVPEEDYARLTAAIKKIFGRKAVLDISIGRPGITIIGGWDKLWPR